MLIDNLFMGAGAMKAGTTWVTKHLKTHKDIYFCYEKEISYFAYLHVPNCKYVLSEDFRGKKAKQYVNATNTRTNDIKRVLLWSANFVSNPVNDWWYAQNFAFRGNKRYSADFSNLYALLDKNGWEHVKSITNNLKVVYIMRDPISRLWSHIRFQMMLDGKIDEMANWTQDDYYKFGKQNHIWRNTNYNKAVRSMQDNLETTQYHFDFFERIKSEPKALLNGIESFLGVEEREYNLDELKGKVNASTSLKRPEFFEDIFGEELYEGVNELKSMGITVPASWKIQ